MSFVWRGVGLVGSFCSRLVCVCLTLPLAEAHIYTCQSWPGMPPAGTLNTLRPGGPPGPRQARMMARFPGAEMSLATPPPVSCSDVPAPAEWLATHWRGEALQRSVIPRLTPPWLQASWGISRLEGSAGLVGSSDRKGRFLLLERALPV